MSPHFFPPSSLFSTLTSRRTFYSFLSHLRLFIHSSPPFPLLPLFPPSYFPSSSVPLVFPLFLSFVWGMFMFTLKAGREETVLTVTVSCLLGLGRSHGVHGGVEISLCFVWTGCSLSDLSRALLFMHCLILLLLLLHHLLCFQNIFPRGETWTSSYRTAWVVFIICSLWSR